MTVPTQGLTRSPERIIASNFVGSGPLFYLQDLHPMLDCACAPEPFRAARRQRGLRQTRTQTQLPQALAKRLAARHGAAINRHAVNRIAPSAAGTRIIAANPTRRPAACGKSATSRHFLRPQEARHARPNRQRPRAYWACGGSTSPERSQAPSNPRHRHQPRRKAGRRSTSEQAPPPAGTYSEAPEHRHPSSDHNLQGDKQ